MIAFLCALQFLSLIPPIVRRAFTGQELGQSVGFYPFVGLLLGWILVGANYGLSLMLPPPVRAGLVLALWVLLSGALHLDGFLDSLDGLFGGYTTEMRLEIMRDERVGAYGLAGGVLLMILKYAALISMPAFTPMLMLIPVLSRWGMAGSLILFPYAREKGLGREIKNHTGFTQLAVATLTALAAAWLTASWMGLLAAGLTAALTMITCLLILRKLPGMTGDLYGAVNELLELSLLVAAAGGLLP